MANLDETVITAYVLDQQVIYEVHKTRNKKKREEKDSLGMQDIKLEKID